MKILVINSGSSSLKFQVIDSETERVLAKGLCERIGIDGRFTYRTDTGISLKEQTAMENHTQAVHIILDTLTDPEQGVISKFGEIDVVGHRLVHGGEKFTGSVVITQEVIQAMTECNDLAPLHNPANLKGILSMENILPNTPQVAVFDTSFHQTIPAKNFMYALPYKYYEEYRVRRYGFHGTSHKYVAQVGCKMTGIDFDHSKIITCHIGNGASITAILDGKSYDTSMGFTPVDGLIMGTRCGSTDPGALIYIAEKEGLNLDRLSGMINKESGLYGITGVSSDMRDIHAAANRGDERAKLALAMFVARIKKFIGQYAALMGGADLIVFTGGVGENDYLVREWVCEGMEYMGILFDKEANDGVRARDIIISTPDSKVKVAAVTTNEELVIASDTFRLLKKRSE